MVSAEKIDNRFLTMSRLEQPSVQTLTEAAGLTLR